MRTTCRGQLFPLVVSVGKKYLNLLSHLAAPLRVFLRDFFFKSSVKPTKASNFSGLSLASCSSEPAALLRSPQECGEGCHWSEQCCVEWRGTEAWL